MPPIFSRRDRPAAAPVAVLPAAVLLEEAVLLAAVLLEEAVLLVPRELKALPQDRAHQRRAALLVASRRRAGGMKARPALPVAALVAAPEEAAAR